MKTMNKIFTIGAMGFALTSMEAKADLFKCLPCPEGMICDGTNKSSCPAGYSCSGGNKTQCPAGTYSPAGNSNCLPCHDGQYQPNKGQSSCSACPVREIELSILSSIAYLDDFESHSIKSNDHNSFNNLFKNAKQEQDKTLFLCKGCYHYWDDDGDYLNAGCDDGVQCITDSTSITLFHTSDSGYINKQSYENKFRNTAEEFLWYRGPCSGRDCGGNSYSLYGITSFHPKMTCDKVTGKTQIKNDIGQVITFD